MIQYLSRTLTRQERNYSTTERECLAVIWAVEKLRHYLEGVHFQVITDHHSLLWLHRLKDPQGRLARWSLRLQPYNFELIHRKGKDHVVPDLLSRSVPQNCDVITPSTDKFPNWRIEQDVLYKFVKLAHPQLATPSDHWKIVVPKPDRKDVIVRCHDEPTSGHTGVYKTVWKVAQRYYWPKMRADVIKYIQHCRTCAEQKPEQKSPPGLMGNRPDINLPWQMISLDFIGPFPRSSFPYVQQPLHLLLSAWRKEYFMSMEHLNLLSVIMDPR